MAVLALSAPAFHEQTTDMVVFLPYPTDILSIILWAQGLEELDNDKFLHLGDGLDQMVRWMKGRGVDEQAILNLMENGLIDWYISNSASLEEYRQECFQLVLGSFESG